MIKFTEGGLIDVWPEKDPEVEALSYALQQQFIALKEHADQIQCFSNVEELNETVLDYLAIELQAMYYEQSMDLDKKREIIKNTMKWHIYAGTPAAVSEMVNVIFGTGRVVEWFDFESPEERIPGTFDIVTDAGFSKNLIEQFNKTIKKVKNARSHLRKVNIERKNDATVFIAGKSVLHTSISIYDHGIEVTTNV